MLSLIRTFKDFKEKIRENSRTLPKLSCIKREEIERGTRDIERRQDWNYEWANVRQQVSHHSTNRVNDKSEMASLGPQCVSDGRMILIYVNGWGLNLLKRFTLE